MRIKPDVKTADESFADKFFDFLYFNDFYIVSAVILIMTLLFIFT